MITSKQTLSEKEHSFEVHTIEWLRLHGSLLDKPRQHPKFQIVWVRKGTGHYFLDLDKYPMVDNTVYFIPPGRMHQPKPLGDIMGYVLSFDVDFLYLSAAGPGGPLHNELLKSFSKVTVLSLKEKGEDGKLANLLKDMLLEFGDYQLLRSEILSGMLNIFLMYLHRLAAPMAYEPTPSKKVDLFNSFYSIVEKHYMSKRQVADYASELSVTPNYLSDVVKRVTGYSASYHIQQRMVLEAKRLAIYSDSNMKLIAYQLGFDDISHFSKFFKNAAGESFTQFRSRQRKTIITT